jgi:hypothetical protein
MERRAQAHHEFSTHQVEDNLSVHGMPADFGHLDDTPFEHAHSDIDARYQEHDLVPHHEVKHDDYGI